MLKCQSHHIPLPIMYQSTCMHKTNPECYLLQVCITREVTCIFKMSMSTQQTNKPRPWISNNRFVGYRDALIEYKKTVISSAFSPNNATNSQCTLIRKFADGNEAILGINAQSFVRRRIPPHQLGEEGASAIIIIIDFGDGLWEYSLVKKTLVIFNSQSCVGQHLVSLVKEYECRAPAQRNELS